MSASVNLPLHHKVQKFSSGTGSPGWSRKKGRKTIVVCGCGMSSYLPLLDELCCRTALFIKSCLESDSPIVSTVACYVIYYGRMNSHVGRNAFFCCS